jgi:translation initiation factor 2 subunit 1
MLFQKKQFPEEDELVLVSITKVNPNSVFATLDHYGGRTGLIHISEVSPGRIRNIRDFVIEGKKAVCKVLKIDPEKGHIDLSLRRVTEIQKMGFLDKIKQEQKAEKLFSAFTSQNKISPEASKKMAAEINREYESLHEFFADIVEDRTTAQKIINDGKKLDDFVKEKIKPEEVELKGKIKAVLFDSDGAEQLKKIFSVAEDAKTQIKYLGAGLYSISIKSKDAKEGDALLKQKTAKVEQFINEHKGTFNFEKEEE